MKDAFRCREAVWWVAGNFFVISYAKIGNRYRAARIKRNEGNKDTLLRGQWIISEQIFNISQITL